MSKSLYDIMNTDEELVNEFFAVLSEMKNTRYILCEKRINSALKLAAYSKILYDFFGRMLKNFDYANEVRGCCTADNRLVMPSNNKKLVAMVFCLLSDIDKKNIYLNDFLRQFYRGDKDINMAYMIFCVEVIEPFVAACKELIFNNDETNPLQQQIKGDYASQASAIIAAINDDTALTQNHKNDLIFQLDKLGHLIRVGEKKAALAMYESLFEELNMIRITYESNMAIKDIEEMIFALRDE